jgi:hypothetical protein
VINGHFCLVILLSCDFDRMFFAYLSSADQSHAICVCVISMHAHQLILSVGTGLKSIFIMFSLPYFGTQSQILFPAKRYF